MQSESAIFTSIDLHLCTERNSNKKKKCASFPAVSQESIAFFPGMEFHEFAKRWSIMPIKLDCSRLFDALGIKMAADTGRLNTFCTYIEGLSKPNHLVPWLHINWTPFYKWEHLRSGDKWYQFVTLLIYFLGGCLTDKYLLHFFFDSTLRHC